MYKLEIYNALTNELFRTKYFKKPDLIMSLIQSAQKGQTCYLFDEEGRTYTGNYVTHATYPETSDSRVYKMFFQINFSEIQARLVAN
ncbi:hypothetical protein R4Z10_05950 [Niallia sp. XMNu-256]|uniref:hypothetical protein n=1 Tax=Niallia sp. XMNu-256 TaxID=3082444 RepID=UPI0030CD0D82